MKRALIIITFKESLPIVNYDFFFERLLRKKAYDGAGLKFLKNIKFLTLDVKDDNKREKLKLELKLLKEKKHEKGTDNI